MRTALVAGATIVALGMAPAAYASTDAGTVAATDHTVAEVLDGVIFGRGEVAAELGAQPTGEAPDATTQEIVDATSDVLLEQILTHEPAAAEQVSADLASGDPYVVEDALVEATALLDRAVQRAYPDLAAQPQVNPQCGVICVCVAAVEIAVAGGIAVVLVAETAVGGHFVLWTKSKFWNSAVEPNGLSADAFTADVTSALAER